MRQPDYKMVQGGNVMVHMSPQVAGSVGKGLARMGQTLANAGVEVAGILEKTAKAAEDGKINDWMRAREKEFNDYRSNLPQFDNDPMKAMPGFDKLHETNLHSIDNLDLSRGAKMRLREEYKKVGHRYEMGLSSWAHGKTIDNTRRFGMERYNGMVDARQYQDAKVMLTKLHADGTISPADYEKAFRALKNTEKDESLRDRINMDPLGQLEEIEKGKGEWETLSPSDRDKYGNVARRKIYHRESAELEDLGAELNDEDFTLETFLENKDSGKYDHIGKKSITTIEKALRDKEPPSDDDVWAANQAVQELREKKEKLSPLEYQKEFNKVTAQVLPLVRNRRNGWLSDALYGLNPLRTSDGGKGARAKAAKTFAINTADQVLEAMHKTGRLEKFGDPDYMSPEDVTRMRGYKKRYRDWVESYRGDVNSPQFEKDSEKALNRIIQEKGVNDGYKRIKGVPSRNEGWSLLGKGISSSLEEIKGKNQEKVKDVMLKSSWGLNAMKTVENAMPTQKVAGFVKNFEGWNPSAYDDFKQMSIGYGTKAKPGEKTITREEAEKRLANELSKSRQHVVDHAVKHGYDFEPHQIDALTSFAYNVGSINQLTNNGKRSPMIIADKMLEYNKAGGRVLKGLSKRRKAERTLFVTGNYTD